MWCVARVTFLVVINCFNAASMLLISTLGMFEINLFITTSTYDSYNIVHAMGHKHVGTTQTTN